MQNVVVDDRRIHVDFSQSVSKLHHNWLQKRTSKDPHATSRQTHQPRNEDNYKMVFDHSGIHAAAKGEKKRDHSEPHRSDDRRRPRH